MVRFHASRDGGNAGTFGPINAITYITFFDKLCSSPHDFKHYTKVSKLQLLLDFLVSRLCLVQLSSKEPGGKQQHFPLWVYAIVRAKNSRRQFSDSIGMRDLFCRNHQHN